MICSVRRSNRSSLDAWLLRRCRAEWDVEAKNLPDALGAAQWLALRETLAYARKNSVFYHSRLADFSLKCSADLAIAPFTTSRDIARWQDFLCVSQGDVARMVSLESSGSMALPKRLAFTEKDLARTKDFFWVGMGQLLESGGVCLILLPGAERPYGVSRLLEDSLTEHGVRVILGQASVSPDSLHADFTRCRAVTAHPPCVVGMPSQLAKLIDNFSGEISGILSSAEPLDAVLTARLEEKFHCLVLDHYGLTESGYGGGVECLAHNGYHLRELDILVEIVEIQGNALVPDGEEGEIVITTLGREAMPLIRYRTGDVSRILPGPCACGSPLRRLAPVHGRIVMEGDQYKIRPVAKGQYREKSAPLAL